MENVYALLKLFGERYINCDNDQAMIDVQYNRDNLVTAFNAILDLCEGAR